jgi:hypothetical protein
MRMRLACLPIALGLLLASQPVAKEGVVGIGVWYAGPGARPPATATSDVDSLRRDLAAIRRAGFNAITTWTSWRDNEPQHETYVLGPVERVIAAAAEADLRVRVVAFMDPPPAWVGGDRDAAARFLRYLSTRLSLQSNVLSVADARAAEVSRERIDVDPVHISAARLAMWRSLAGGTRYLAFATKDDPVSPAVLSLGETAGVVTRNQALFGPLRPRAGGVTRVSGADPAGNVEVRFLESADALVIIGSNPDPVPRKVSIAFAPEIPEAIWQNLEAGTAVQFIVGKEGPSFEYTFGPRDALVLMIRKRLR